VVFARTVAAGMIKRPATRAVSKLRCAFCGDNCDALFVGGWDSPKTICRECPSLCIEIVRDQSKPERAVS
jgi:hypothetical protein